MTIHGKKINVKLRKDTPDQLSASDLKAQLTAIGLTCDLTDESLLTEYIEDVRRKLITGSTQSFAIGEYIADNFVHTSRATWSPEEEALGYKTQLIYIGIPQHFKWLMENCSTFAGNEDNPPASTDKYDNVEAVKNAFIQIAEGSSETLVEPLDKKDMESALTNLLSSINDENIQDYDSKWRIKLFLLIDGFDKERNYGDGIGVLGIRWRLQIKDYKKKSKDNAKHNTTINLNSWSVIYDNTDDLLKQYNMAKNYFG
ncbi:hypothetical protein [Photorhabdus luminescens]|uniref:Uncharacterized protein n=1 Tax=Photorhabdus luminescens subsp. sonorensis TaxID=1173677 RepID=A0A5C4RHZ4_PHOLU|nr:hypothetical protein [Photorhabdus luminescens]TNH43692.1 hypothetical protein EP164_10185 [Photorhabdus luminescens subsp. sonorensis]